MPPTNDPPGGFVVLVDGLSRFGLTGFRPRIDTAVRETLAAQNLLDADGAEISVTFLDDDRIAALHRRWLGRSGPTDVLAFGLGESPVVGDVYVSVDTARRNAAVHDVDPAEELLRLVVHGVLHVCGYDHPKDEDRSGSRMYALQERLVERLLDRRPET